MNTLMKKTTQSGYLLVSGYIKQFYRSVKLSRRVSLPITLIITMYYPVNYNIYTLDCDDNYDNDKTVSMRWRRMGMFSLLCDDINGLYCNNNKYIIKTILNDIYFSGSSVSGFHQLPKNNSNKKKNDVIEIISHGKFAKHTIMISKHNNFYTFGTNKSGQFGCGERWNNNSVDNKMYAVNLLRVVFHSIKLKSIKCGTDHTIFLTQKGRVLCCGENKFGQIGILNKCNDKCIDYRTIPTVVPFLYNIIEIDCGRKHNLCLDNRGNVYCFGFNEQSQLGLGINYDNKDIIDIPIINRYFLNNNIPISSIRCGYDHSSAIDINGYFYTFGANENGQCGNGQIHQWKVSDPYLVFSTKIEDASLGYNHTALISKDNNIWTFGANFCNQCSTKIHVNKHLKTPYLLKKKEEIGISKRQKIFKVLAGHSTTLIVTSCVLY